MRHKENERTETFYRRSVYSGDLSGICHSVADVCISGGFGVPECDIPDAATSNPADSSELSAGVNSAARQKRCHSDRRSRGAAGAADHGADRRKRVRDLYLYRRRDAEGTVYFRRKRATVAGWNRDSGTE